LAERIAFVTGNLKRENALLIQMRFLGEGNVYKRGRNSIKEISTYFLRMAERRIGEARMRKMKKPAPDQKISQRHAESCTLL
jgi:hypothetical protein